MVIKFYQNGIFTVDDGPPRSAEDPANQAFLQAIKERRVPDELAAEFMDGLDLSIMPMSEDYDPAKAPKYASTPTLFLSSACPYGTLCHATSASGTCLQV